jgi:GTP-sensing pleiotropic transcriptional regulator CodY
MNFPSVTYQKQKIFQISSCILSRAENCLGFPFSPSNEQENKNKLRGFRPPLVGEVSAKFSG